jgi:hypothetical protein
MLIKELNNNNISHVVGVTMFCYLQALNERHVAKTFSES